MRALWKSDVMYCVVACEQRGFLEDCAQPLGSWNLCYFRMHSRKGLQSKARELNVSFGSECETLQRARLGHWSLIDSGESMVGHRYSALALRLNFRGSTPDAKAPVFGVQKPQQVLHTWVSRVWSWMRMLPILQNVRAGFLWKRSRPGKRHWALGEEKGPWTACDWWELTECQLMQCETMQWKCLCHCGVQSELVLFKNGTTHCSLFLRLLRAH